MEQVKLVVAGLVLVKECKEEKKKLGRFDGLS